MIIDFSIKNFKAIKDEVTLSFVANKSDKLEDYYIINSIPNLRLLKMAIIYGPNASGKTTILEALNVLRNIVLKSPKNKAEKNEFIKPFLGSKETIKSDTCFKIGFIANNIRYLYKIQLNKECITYEKLNFYPNKKKALVFERFTDINKKTSDIKFGSTIKISKNDKNNLIFNTLWNATVLSSYMKANISIEAFDNAIDWFENVLYPLIYNYYSVDAARSKHLVDSLDDAELKNKIIDFLKTADFWVEDIRVEKHRVIISEEEKSFIKATIQLLNKKGEKLTEDELEKDEIEEKNVFLKHRSDETFELPFEEESNGTKRYLNLAYILYILSNKNKVMSIDELENSLHPDLIKHFLITFLKESKNSQIIIATHHRELLMEKDIIRKDVIWFTDKKDDGSVDLYSLADFNTSSIRKGNSIYNFYKIGKLGGVPNVD